MFYYQFHEIIILGTIEGGWNSVNTELAEKYESGGYPEIASMIRSVR